MINHEIPTCFVQNCELKCGHRHPKPCKLFQEVGQCAWKTCSYAHSPRPAGMHASYQAPPPVNPVLFLGQVENDQQKNLLSKQLQEALETIHIQNKQIQELTGSQKRLEENISNISNRCSALELENQSLDMVSNEVIEATRTLEPKLLKMANEAVDKMETKFTNKQRI